MKQNVSKSTFMDSFKIRKDNFSYEGLDTLYDYLIDLEQDMDKETELDVIALCCSYTEYENLKEFQESYGSEYKTIEDIEEDAMVFKIDREFDSNYIDDDNFGMIETDAFIVSNF